MCVSVFGKKAVPVRMDGRGQRAPLPFKGSVSVMFTPSGCTHVAPPVNPALTS